MLMQCEPIKLVRTFLVFYWAFELVEGGVVEKKINCYYVKCSLTKSIS